jgi:flagellar biosynthesis/type III secretory pathway M-ring protein FliF/YscJ
MDAMDLIRKYFATIKAQLAGLTISQKLLIGLLGVVMLATVFFTVVFSAKPAMVPLIAQSMSAEDISRVEMLLKGKYDYQVSGDKVLVPLEQAYAIRGELASQHALPKDLTTAFSRVVMDANPFQTEATKERQWSNALQEELTRWLCEFPYLENGEVIIGHGQRQGLGVPAMPSTASVIVKTRDNVQLTGNQVLAIVEMVTGAVPGLNRENVRVTDGQRSYRAPNSDTPLPADLLAVKKSIEDDMTAKLLSMFDHYGDVKIAVNAVPDLSVRVKETEAFDPKTTVVKPRTETSRETSSSEGTVAEGQPGVPPNTGTPPGDAGKTDGHKQNSTSNDTSTQNEIRFGSTREHITLPAGVELKDQTASLLLPRSYFVSVYRRGVKDPKVDPEDDKLQPLIDKEIKIAQAQAKNVIGARSDDQIQVGWYDDTILSRTTDVALASSGLASANLPVVVGRYAKPAILFAVALCSAFWMLRMVRSAVPAGTGDAVDAGVFFNTTGGKKPRGNAGAVEVDSLNAAEDVFGEANEGNAVLTGIELDDETLQSRKMVDEVSTMIKENPENAAALVKRWLTKGK